MAKIDLKKLSKQPQGIKDIADALGQVLTVGEFVKIVQKRTKNKKISSATIHYHLNKTDNLDWVEWCGLCLIIQNEKADNFTPGDYYGNKNITVTSF